jgi:hypothetical protein
VKLHPRYAITTAAEIQIGEAISAAITEHDITYAELLVILAGQQQKWATYLLRTERHPKHPDRKANEA